MEQVKNLFKKNEPKALKPTIHQDEEPKDYLKLEDIKNIFIEQFAEFKKTLPDSQCFTCRTMMYGYKLGHADHLFCSEACLKEYKRMNDYHDPKEVSKTIKGEKIKVINS